MDPIALEGDKEDFDLVVQIDCRHCALGTERAFAAKRKCDFIQWLTLLINGFETFMVNCAV